MFSSFTKIYMKDNCVNSLARISFQTCRSWHNRAIATLRFSLLSTRKHQETSNSQSPTHPRPAECGSRQVLQTGPDHPNRVVPPSRGLQNNMQQVAPASNRPLCYEVQQQVASICVTGTGSPGHSSGYTQSTMGGSGRICLPASGHLGQSGGEVAGLPMQENHSDCSGVAQHALVLGPSGHVQSDSTEPGQPANTALQSDPSQKFDKPKSPWMAPRATAIKE